jgi:hypothetical protein
MHFCLIVCIYVCLLACLSVCLSVIIHVFAFVFMFILFLDQHLPEVGVLIAFPHCIGAPKATSRLADESSTEPDAARCCHRRFDSSSQNQGV